MNNMLEKYRICFNNYLYSDKCVTDLITLVNKIKKYNKILIFGNGGSNTIATHFSEDMAKMIGVPALTFNDAALMSCLSNDYSYEDSIKKWMKIYYTPGCLVIGISSSGESSNIINGVLEANPEDIITLTGFKKNNSLSKLGSLNIHTPFEQYGIVENLHSIILHLALDILITEQQGDK